MKKLIALMLLGTLAFSLTACDMDLDALFGRQNPDFERVEELPSDMKIAYGGDGQPGDGDMAMIYQSDGNGMVSVVRPGETDTDDEPGQADTPAENVTVEALTGEWHSASRSGDVIATRYYWFNDDGTFSSSSGEYMHSTSAPELFPDFDEGWYAVPMGYPLSFGTYELDGSELILSYTGEEYSEGYEEPIVYRIPVYSLSGEEMVLGDGWDESAQNRYINASLLRENGDSFEALCEKLEIDMQP